MDGFNEKSTEQVQEQQPLGCLRRFSKTIKVITVSYTHLTLPTNREV